MSRPQIELLFTITDVPQSRAIPDLYCYLEGELIISINEVTIFHEPSVTLVELACQLANWLDRGFADGAAFKFESMDHDEPILIFEPEPAERFAIDSIWGKAPPQAGISAGMLKRLLLIT